MYLTKAKLGFTSQCVCMCVCHYHKQLRDVWSSQGSTLTPLGGFVELCIWINTHNIKSNKQIKTATKTTTTSTDSFPVTDPSFYSIFRLSGLLRSHQDGCPHWPSILISPFPWLRSDIINILRVRRHNPLMSRSPNASCSSKLTWETPSNKMQTA